jgi:hypothetical protein
VSLEVATEPSDAADVLEACVRQRVLERREPPHGTADRAPFPPALPGNVLSLDRVSFGYRQDIADLLDERAAVLVYETIAGRSPASRSPDA